MNRIVKFIDFFSTIEAEFDYTGPYPYPKVFCLGDWELKGCNGKDLMEFDSETRNFSQEVSSLKQFIELSPIKIPGGYTRAGLIFGLSKAKDLLEKITFRESLFNDHEDLEENNGTVWYFKGNEVIKTYIKLYGDGVADKTFRESVNIEDLTKFTEELISVDIKWLKKILQTLVPVLKILIDSGGKEKIKVSAVAKIPNNFISKKFQPDVVNSLFENFVRLGYLLDEREQKKSFQNAFSTKEYHREISTKIVWKGRATVLRGFILSLGVIDPKFKSKEIKRVNWYISDKIFKIPGNPLSKEGSNGHYGSKEEIRAVAKAINKALENFDPSEK